MDYLSLALLAAAVCFISGIVCVICFVYYNCFKLNNIKKFKDIRKLWQPYRSNNFRPTASI